MEVAMLNNRNTGFTLVELMVAAALASLVLGSAFGIWSYTRRNLARTSTRQILQQDATRILTQLKADLKAAKAETFKAGENPMSLEFIRYVVDKNDNTKLSAEQTEPVKYAFVKPILRRSAGDKGAKSLSNSVENIRISRKSLSAEQKEKDAYLESRVDITLEMKSMVPGSKIEESYTTVSSVVIRDEFYALVNKDRQEIFEVAKEVATEISKPGDSQFFNDQLDANALKSLTDEQLTDLDNTQTTNLKDAKEAVSQINGRIEDVETGKKWWQGFFFGLGANEEGAAVEALRDQLIGIKYDNDNIPAKGSGSRASEKVVEIGKELDKTVARLETTFIADSYKNTTFFDINSTDPEQKRKAESQKRAYDMKVMDRQIDMAIAKMSEEELAAAEQANELPKKMIDQYVRSEADIRREITSSGIAQTSSEIDAMVAKEVAEMNFLRSQYNSCDLAWMEDSSKKNQVLAYDAAKQLKNLADSKKDMLILQEMAIDNKAEIARARELKKEALESES